MPSTRGDHWILVCGLPGTGKTSFARALAAALGAAHGNTDTLREQMGLRGHYQTQDKNLVYDALLTQAVQWARNGRIAVMDATFYQVGMRETWKRRAREEGIAIHWIEVRADDEVIRRRVSQPRPDSEADEAVYTRIRAEWAPLQDPHLVLRSDELDIREMVRQALHWLPVDPIQHPS